MKQYADKGGDSGIAGYEIEDDTITVHFTDKNVYLYSCASAGRSNIEQMKSLAQQGQGLNAYINQHVRKRYARKFKVTS